MNDDLNDEPKTLTKAKQFSKQKIVPPNKKNISELEQKLDDLSVNLPEYLPLINIDEIDQELLYMDLRRVKDNTVIDCHVEVLLLKGETNVNEIARSLNIGWDRASAACKRVITRWQVLGSFRDLDVVRGERLASINYKTKIYWSLLNPALEEFESNLDMARKTLVFNMDKREAYEIQEARNKVESAQESILLILREMHKWEVLHNDMLGLTTRFMEQQYEAHLREMDLRSYNDDTLTPEEWKTFEIVEKEFMAAIKEIVADINASKKKE